MTRFAGYFGKLVSNLLLIKYRKSRILIKITMRCKDLGSLVI